MKGEIDRKVYTVNSLAFGSSTQPGNAHLGVGLDQGREIASDRSREIDDRQECS